MTAVDGSTIVSSSAVLSSGVVSAGHLTPDSLFIYMQTRLDGIDTQVKAAFSKQEKIEAVKKEIMAAQNALAGLPEDAKEIPTGDANAIATALVKLNELDPHLAQKLSESLPEEFRITDPTKANDMVTRVANAHSMQLGNDGTKGPTTTFKNALSELESSAQLEMIQLQSTMSARQTAIQLCTNLVAALGKGSEAIASNIGR